MKKNYFRDINSTVFDESLGENGKYLPSYPLIWTPSREIEKNWSKFYDVLVTDYCEKYEFLNLTELGFYAFNLTFARLKKGIIIKPFSKRYGISDNTLTAMIDKFSDLELCDRVARVDHRGHPNDIVLRPPKSPTTLKTDHERLRNNLGKTAFLRKELGKDFPVNQFSEREITAALGMRNAHHAGKFHELCILQNSRVLQKNRSLKVTSKEYKDAFLPAIHYFCEKNGIPYENDKIVNAALKIASNYGRKPCDLDLELEKSANKKLRGNYEI